MQEEHDRKKRRNDELAVHHLQNEAVKPEPIKPRWALHPLGAR
jgi:hypothetical protein